MPRATLSFTLPEETDEHRAALQGGDLLCAVRAFETYLRQTIKHAGLPEREIALLYDVQTKLLNYLEDQGVNLY